MRDTEKNILFLCSCGDVADQIIMNYWTDYETDDYPCVYVSFHLNTLPFFKRLWLGIKYIFGYKSKYGDFSELILRPKDYTKMQEVANFLKKVYDYEEEKENKTDAKDNAE